MAPILSAFIFPAVSAVNRWFSAEINILSVHGFLIHTVRCILLYFCLNISPRSNSLRSKPSPATDTSIIRTPKLGPKETRAHLICTSIIQTLSSVLLVSELQRFDCVELQQFGPKQENTYTLRVHSCQSFDSVAMTLYL